MTSPIHLSESTQEMHTSNFYWKRQHIPGTTDEHQERKTNQASIDSNITETRELDTSNTPTNATANPFVPAPRESSKERPTVCPSLASNLSSMGIPLCALPPPPVGQASIITTQMTNSKSPYQEIHMESTDTKCRPFPLDPDEAYMEEEPEVLARIRKHAEATREQMIKFEKEVEDLKGDPEKHVEWTVKYLYKIGFRQLSSTVWTVYKNRSDQKPAPSVDEQLTYERTYLHCLLEDAF